MFDYFNVAGYYRRTRFCDFIVHGGLSPSICTIDEMRTLKRDQEIPHEGPFCDLMWSDPEDIEEWGIHESPRCRVFVWFQGHVQVQSSEQTRKLICRAHRADARADSNTTCVSSLSLREKSRHSKVWSAPNYCYRCGNIASILRFDDNLEREFRIFKKRERRVTRTGTHRMTSVLRADYFL